jgi:hypothetical protein
MAKRASRTVQDGRVGETTVKRIFEDLGWGPVPVSEHDTGTDLFVQVRDANLFELGLLLGVQVKNEKRYFTEKARARALRRESPGWYYRAEQDDVTYWRDHAVPHILVLYDRDTGAAYWAHVAPESVTWTAKAARVWVPAVQQLTSDSLGDLLRVATTRRRPSAWTGSLWDDASSVVPTIRLRYALLAPRIVAPHLNRRIESLSAEEAIASLVLGRYDELADGRGFHTLPKPEERPSSSFLWQLFDGLHQYLNRAELLPLHDVVSREGLLPFQTAAAVALLATALAEQGDYREALDRLDAVALDDLTDPLDRAWIETHRARCLLELGDAEHCRETALRAAAVAAFHPDDPTALALQAASLNLVFTVADRERAVDMIRANDSVPIWWRAQQRAWALSGQFKITFDIWAGAQDGDAATEREGWWYLRSLALLAGLAGDHTAWRTAASQLAQLGLITSHATVTADDYAATLRALRLSGDTKSLKLVVDKIQMDGPLEALTAACTDLDLSRSTWTSREADLELAQAAAEFMTDETAERHATWAFHELLEPSTPFLPAHLPRFAVVRDLLRLLTSLWPNLHGQLCAAVRGHLVAMPAVDDFITAERYADLVRQMDVASWSTTELTAIRARLTRDPSDGREEPADDSGIGDHKTLAGAWRWLLAEVEPADREQLMAEASHGSWDAILAINNLARFPNEIAARIIEHLRTELSARANAAAAGSGAAFGGPHPGQTLVQMNVLYPHLADWEPITRIIEGPAHPLDQIYVLNKIAALADNIPAATASTLATAASKLAGQPAPDRFEQLDPRAAAKGVVYALQDPLAKEELLEQRLADREDGRRSVARAVGINGSASDAPILAALAGDADRRVRAEVTSACIRWLMRGVGISVADRLVAQALDEDGARHAYAALRPMPHDRDLPELHHLLLRLESHPSAAVRCHAAELRSFSRTGAGEPGDPIR